VTQADGPTTANELPVVQSVLKRLVSTQKPAGDYATTVVRDAGCPQIYFAFENEADARKFAAAVAAEATGSFPGWASGRAFPVNDAVLADLASSLPPPKTQRRKPESDGPSMSGGRVWRGARTPIKHHE
jgi:hypothetical protein